MNICIGVASWTHEEIVHEGWVCPLCSMKDESDKHELDFCKAEERIAEMEDELAEKGQDLVAENLELQEQIKQLQEGMRDKAPF